MCDWLSDVEFTLLSDTDSEIACDNSADTDCDTETEASVLAWASTEELVDSWIVDATAGASEATVSDTGAALNTAASEFANTSWFVVAWLSKAGAVVSSAWAV